MYLFSEMPIKQGMLFAEDEPKMDVDEENTSGLVAKAKITQFEVKTFSYLTSAGRFSHKCDTLCYNSAGFFFFFKGAGNTE